jgi:hypothetical protein
MSELDERVTRVGLPHPNASWFHPPPRSTMPVRTLVIAAIVAAMLSLVARSALAKLPALPLTVTADDTVPIEARAAAIRSVARWNAALGRVVFVWRVVGPTAIVVTARPELDRSTWLGAWERTSEGCTSTGVIELRLDDHCAALWSAILTHELGHALGLNHDDATGSRSVMRRTRPPCGRDMHDEIDAALRRRALDLLSGER